VRAIVANEAEERVEETLNGVEVVRLPRWREYSSTPIVRRDGAPSRGGGG
jgi:hypothetical protein